MAYSRANPSPRYQELVRLYREMHIEGDKAHGLAPEQTFPGRSLPRQAHRIKPLIAQTGSRTILDYGSGKGTQYRPAPIKQDGEVRWNSIQEYWGVESIRCYDPAYVPHSEIPAGRFDGVVSTDVLEHCPEDDLDWIIAEMFSYADKFVFANVACYPASKKLPNGENAHCTIRPTPFWRGKFESIAAAHPSVVWEIWIDELSGKSIQEVRAGSFEKKVQAVAPASGRPPIWRMV